MDEHGSCQSLHRVLAFRVRDYATPPEPCDELDCSLCELPVWVPRQILSRVAHHGGEWLVECLQCGRPHVEEYLKSMAAAELISEERCRMILDRVYERLDKRTARA